MKKKTINSLESLITALFMRGAVRISRNWGIVLIRLSPPLMGTSIHELMKEKKENTQ